MGGRAAAAPPWITCGDGFITVQILARPGASRRRIVRLEARGLVIALNSPPEKGKANDELIDLLARTLRVPRTTMTIVHGQNSRQKTVRIATANPAGLASALTGLATATF